MAFEDKFRLSSHAVFINDDNQVLLLKANYGSKSWCLPGGALEPGETIHEALLRKCQEELGLDVSIQHLTGVYYLRHTTLKPLYFGVRCHSRRQYH